MKKKIAAVILTLTLCSTCVTPVFASEGADAAAETGSEIVIMEELNADGPDSSETDIFYTDVSDLDEAEIIDPADLADPAGETEWISEDDSDIEDPVTEDSFYEEVSSPDAETDISEESIPEKNIFEDISAFEEVSDLQGPDVDPETAEEFKEDPKDEKDSGDEPEAQSGGIAVNETNFPDDNFRTYISENCDIDGNGLLSESEIRDVLNIDCSGLPISTLEGIKYFTYLEYLTCMYNELQQLDVSNCTSLKELDCSSNELINLNVSGCSALVKLECAFNQLQQLDAGSCSSLNWLGCEGNQLQKLDVSGCASLAALNCGANQLRQLKVNNGASLKNLYCSDNQLQQLDVSGCTSLYDLTCFSNQLQKLNGSGCSSLSTLWCSDNQLQKLDVRGCSSLDSLRCDSNRLQQLYVRGCSSLWELGCNGNQLQQLDVTGCNVLIAGVKYGVVEEEDAVRRYLRVIPSAEDPGVGEIVSSISVDRAVVLYQNGKVLKTPNYITAKNITRTTAATAQKVSIGAAAQTATTLSYKSDNALVKVSSRGVVTIPKNFVGSAVITIKGKATSVCNAVTTKIKVTVKPKATSLTKLTNPSKSKLTAVWKRNSKVTGYQIQYAANSSFSSAKTVTVKGNTTVKKSITTSIKKGKTYYVRIRTYKTVDGKNYFSGWSKALKLKITK